MENSIEVLNLETSKTFTHEIKELTMAEAQANPIMVGSIVIVNPENGSQAFQTEVVEVDNDECFVVVLTSTTNIMGSFDYDFSEIVNVK